MLKNQLTMIKFMLAMDRVFLFITLVPLIFFILLNFYCQIFFMFLLFKRIYFQLVNSLKIIMCLLTFILLVSLLRTSPRAKFFSRGLLSMVCIPCLICCLHLLLLSPSLVPVLLSLNGTIALVILPFVQQVVARHKLPLSSNKAPVLCSACQQAKSHGLPFA